MHKLVLLRHGQSQWNLENRFTGWTDVDLTKHGISEAVSAGQTLFNNGYKFDIIYTSVLNRAIQTMELCISKMKIKNIKIEYDWRLNERHYGRLQGLNKLETAKKYGEKQVKIWRRSYDVAPPTLNYDDPKHPRFDKKYSELKLSQIPNSESLKDTSDRFMPLWNQKIKKNILLGKLVLIVAHGNSLRALVKKLNNLSNEQILQINIPTGIPLVYELDNNLISIKDYYLGDKKIISKKITEVSNQGKAKL